MKTEHCPACESEDFQLVTLRIERCKKCGRTVFDLNTNQPLSPGSISLLKALLSNINYAARNGI